MLFRSIVISSTTKVANLNVEQVDGYDASIASSANTIVVRDANANISANNYTAAGLITVTGNVTAGNIITGGIMSSAGNATHGNISTAGIIVSSIATGTAPFTVTSTTQVANLNVATAGVAGTVSGAAQANITSDRKSTRLNSSHT